MAYKLPLSALTERADRGSLLLGLQFCNTKMLFQIIVQFYVSLSLVTELKFNDIGTVGYKIVFCRERCVVNDTLSQAMPFA